ncbi:hypothetical protein FRB95_006887 [Tulasnella sp. JGI-2019a]|nr:hypothetical protein FRB95_006887 [Tulasnella sp. JGI-2019a]
MDDYMVQVLDIFSEGASQKAKFEPSLNDPKLTESQTSCIMMRVFDEALKTFSNGLHRHHSAKARHHNTLLPISRLPNDLLVGIFVFASEMEYRPMRGCRREVRMLATLVFVCREWREIVHDAPSLWAYISSQHSHMANLECLAKSDQIPL